MEPPAPPPSESDKADDELRRLRARGPASIDDAVAAVEASIASALQVKERAEACAPAPIRNPMPSKP